MVWVWSVPLKVHMLKTWSPASGGIEKLTGSSVKGLSGDRAYLEVLGHWGYVSEEYVLSLNVFFWLSVSWLPQVSGFLSPYHSLKSLSCLKQWTLLTMDWNHWKPGPTMIVLPYADFPRYFCHRKRRLINTRTDFLNSLSLTLPAIV